MGKPKVPGENGEGSVFQRQDGRWCAQLFLGWARGRRVRKCFYGNTQEAVEAKLEKAKMKLAAGLPVTRKRVKRAPRYARQEVSVQTTDVTELTNEVQARICDGVGIGLYPQQAARLAGVGAAIFGDWIEQAGNGVERYVSLMQAIEKAETTCEAKLVQTLHDAGLDSPQVALRILERRFPTRWSEPATRLAVAGSEGINLGGLQIQINLIPASEDPEAASRNAKLLNLAIRDDEVPN